MKRFERKIGGAIIGLIVIILFANPLMSATPANLAFAAQPFGTVAPPEPDFENVFTSTASASSEFDTLESFNASDLDEIAAEELEDYLLIGDKLYRIGDEFLDDTRTNHQGYLWVVWIRYNRITPRPPLALVYRF